MWLLTGLERNKSNEMNYAHCENRDDSSMIDVFLMKYEVHVYLKTTKNKGLTLYPRKILCVLANSSVKQARA